MTDNLQAPKPEQSRSTSHGRGGAGNINKSANKPGTDPSDLVTPQIKQNTYTTGRGGTGNMATNLAAAPEMARAAQDVDTPAHHGKEPKGTYHWGRGGEGNRTTVGMTREEEKESHRRPGSKERKASGERNGGGRGSFGNIVGKGKELLGLKKDAKKEGANGGSAVE